MGTFINRNICKSVNFDVTTSPVALPSTICSQVTIVNSSSVDILVWDDPESGTVADKSFIVMAGDTFTFLGLTNQDQLSCASVTGTGKIYARSQYFSGNVLTQ